MAKFLREIGYARVSTDEQNLDLQLGALKVAGCDDIFTDDGILAIAKIRPSFKAAIAALNEGDTLVLWKLGGGFRSTIDAILTFDALRERGVQFQCLTMQIDTSTPEGRKWYRDTASWAEYERELIGQRTKARMAAAKKRGKHVGRSRVLSEAQIRHAMAMVHPGKQSITGMAALFSCDRKIVERSLKRAKGTTGGEAHA